MDILCPKCGKPWNVDDLHKVGLITFDEAFHQFQEIGCEILDSNHNYPPDEDAALLASTIYGILGGDVDGAANEFADLGY